MMANRNLYAIYRMLSFPTTLSDDLDFKIMILLNVKITQNG